MYDCRRGAARIAAALGLLILATSLQAADTPPKADRRWDVEQTLKFEGPQAIIAPVAAGQPAEASARSDPDLDERLVSAAEQAQKIRIARDSMIKSQKCLRQILTSNTHLIKVAAGLRVIEMAVELKADLSKHSLISPMKARKLEGPELTIILRYDRPGSRATRMVFSGYRYH